MRVLGQQIHKHPHTQFIEGSRIQPGDEDLDSIAFQQIIAGHYLTGGKRGKHFNQIKTWAGTHPNSLYGVLCHRHIFYCGRLYAKHTIYYNKLPHYFSEFDILYTTPGAFLSTPARKALLKPLGFVQSVKVLHQGPLHSIQDLTWDPQISLQTIMSGRFINERWTRLSIPIWPGVKKIPANHGWVLQKGRGKRNRFIKSN